MLAALTASGASSSTTTGEDTRARTAMLEAMAAWVREEQRLVEKRSGKLLLHAAFVRVVVEGNVTRVSEVLQTA